MGELHREHSVNPWGPVVPKAEKTCRDCGQPFLVRADKLTSTVKWWSLCCMCIRWEM